MKEDGVEYNLENLDTRALSDAKSKELLLRLRKASDLIKSTQRQDTILYLKFDKPPDRYSADFTELLTIRYRDGPHPLRDFLLQLSLPALLKVSHDLTIKCLSDNQQYLNDFAKYAGKNAELQAPFVRRAEDVLPEDCKVHFHRDHAIYQINLLHRITSESLPPSNNNLPLVETASSTNNELVEADVGRRNVNSRSDRPANRASEGDAVPNASIPPPAILNIIEGHTITVRKEKLVSFLSVSEEALFWIVLPVDFKIAPMIELSPAMLAELIEYLRS